MVGPSGNPNKRAWIAPNRLAVALKATLKFVFWFRVCFALVLQGEVAGGCERTVGWIEELPSPLLSACLGTTTKPEPERADNPNTLNPKPPDRQHRWCERRGSLA